LPDEPRANIHDSPDAIRTGALLGHAGCGKISLVEALVQRRCLHTLGSIDSEPTVAVAPRVVSGDRNEIILQRRLAYLCM